MFKNKCCKGVTKKNEPCSKKVFGLQDYCHLHRFQFEDCSQCYDNKVSPQDVLNCKHALCQVCISNLLHFSCPTCRTEISERFLTEEVKTKINARDKYYDDQDDFLFDPDTDRAFTSWLSNE
jgi:hypothetical protein